jgi:hypothetical protein
MIEKMDLNKDDMINVAELLDLTNILNVNQFEEEIKFMFAPFADKSGTCKSISLIMKTLNKFQLKKLLNKIITNQPTI